jgi:hypothetical protein
MASEHNTRSSGGTAAKGGGEGKQFVVDTSRTKGDTTSQKKDYKSAKSCTTHWEDPEHLEKNLQAYKTFQETNRQAARDKEEGQDKKRGHGVGGSSSNKKQKSNGGQHDAPTAPAGSITRVPKKGQKVKWHSVLGYQDGEVVEVVYEDKEVEGTKAKGSKEEPRVVLKSASSGELSVHKPNAVFFE